MSDASLPRRSPRWPVPAPRTSGGNSTSGGGGGSHLKPPAPGFSCRNETAVGRTPQEDIDDSPPPGRAAQFRAPAARSSQAKPSQSAASCPRSPPRSPGHGQRLAAPLPGRSRPASGGRGQEQAQQTERQRKTGRDYCPKPPAAAASPTLPAPTSAHSPPRPSPARAARPGRRAPGVRSRGPGRVGGPRARHVARARALSVPLLGSWAPQNPQLPRSHRPQLAPPPRFSAMQLQGSLFPRLRIPTPPGSQGGGGQVWWGGAGGSGRRGGSAR